MAQRIRGNVEVALADTTEAVGTVGLEQRIRGHYRTKLFIELANGARFVWKVRAREQNPLAIIVAIGGVCGLAAGVAATAGP